MLMLLAHGQHLEEQGRVQDNQRGGWEEDAGSLFLFWGCTCSLLTQDNHPSSKPTSLGGSLGYQQGPRMRLGVCVSLWKKMTVLAVIVLRTAAVVLQLPWQVFSRIAEQQLRLEEVSLRSEGIGVKKLCGLLKATNYQWCLFWGCGRLGHWERGWGCY